MFSKMVAKEPEIVSLRSVENLYEQTVAKNGGYFPVLMRNPQDQSLLLFYRSQAGHLGKTGALSLLRSQDGIQWDDLGVIIKNYTDIRNPAVFINDDGSVLVAAYQYDAYYGKDDQAEPLNKKASFKINFYHSDRELKNWQKYEPRITAEIGINSPYGKIIRVNDKLLMPIYDGNQYASLLISGDLGKNWDTLNHIMFGYREPAITVAPDGHLVAVMHGNLSIVHSSATFVSHSYDGGDVWTTPIQITEEKTYPADLLALSNGYLLMTAGVRQNAQQYITAILSKDNGHTWAVEDAISLNKKPYINCDFGYPSTVEVFPGDLITSYYVKPSNSKRFSFNDQGLYDNRLAELKVVHYSLKDLLAAVQP